MSRWPKLIAFLERVGARPAVRQACLEEGLQDASSRDRIARFPPRAGRSPLFIVELLYCPASLTAALKTGEGTRAIRFLGGSCRRDGPIREVPEQVEASTCLSLEQQIEETEHESTVE